MAIKRRWTAEEDEILVQLIKEYPHNKSKAFLMASERLGRTKGTCNNRWYSVLSNPEHPKYVGCAFTMLSRKTKFDNRTQYTEHNTTSPEPMKESLWNRIKRFLRLI